MKYANYVLFYAFWFPGVSIAQRSIKPDAACLAGERPIDLSAQFPEPSYQGDFGTCAFHTAASLASATRNRHLGLNGVEAPSVSPLWLYSSVMVRNPRQAEYSKAEMARVNDKEGDAGDFAFNEGSWQDEILANFASLGPVGMSAPGSNGQVEDFESSARVLNNSELRNFARPGAKEAYIQSFFDNTLHQGEKLGLWKTDREKAFDFSSARTSYTRTAVNSNIPRRLIAIHRAKAAKGRLQWLIKKSTLGNASKPDIDFTSLAKQRSKELFDVKVDAYVEVICASAEGEEVLKCKNEVEELSKVINYSLRELEFLRKSRMTDEGRTHFAPPSDLETEEEFDKFFSENTYTGGGIDAELAEVEDKCETLGRPALQRVTEELCHGIPSGLSVTNTSLLQKEWKGWKSFSDPGLNYDDNGMRRADKFTQLYGHAMIITGLEKSPTGEKTLVIRNSWKGSEVVKLSAKHACLISGLTTHKGPKDYNYGPLERPRVVENHEAAQDAH